VRIEAALIALLACRGDHRPSCPGDEVHAGSDTFCLVTCAGALEDGVSFSGWTPAGRFDDGLVLVPITPTPTPAVLPEVCRKLPRGCACTTPACTWAQRRHVGSDIGEATDPRCEATDPDCGPEAFDHDCIPAHYHRYPIFPGPSPRNCRWDGECVNSGCGYACEPVSEAGRVFTCEGHRDLDELLDGALCGCVSGACQWFNPQPRP
jgi:hypothetical protein